jgi:hypothetical protein
MAQATSPTVTESGIMSHKRQMKNMQKYEYNELQL